MLTSLFLSGCSTASTPSLAAPDMTLTAAPTVPHDRTTLRIAFVGRLADEQIAHFQDEVA
jgi:hypothetical protein